MASSITPKVLHIVFCQIREQQGAKALLPSTRVCQHWKEIACRNLYTHVVLTNKNLGSFIDSAIKHPEHLKAIKSLTIQIQAVLLPAWPEDPELRESHRQNGLLETRTLLDQLSQLAELVLSNTKNLSTFSLFVSAPQVPERNELDYIGFRIDNKVLGDLLNALPPSCVNLELDTGMANWSPEDKPHHVCSDIWNLLPRMRHVKLRMQSLCSRILCINPEDPEDRLIQPDLTSFENMDEQHVVKANKLCTLSICTRSRGGAGPRFAECSFLQRHLNQGGHEPWGSSLDGRVQNLAANLAAAYQAGRFPKATNLALSQPWFRTPSRENNEKKSERAQVYRNVMLLRDCITNITLPQPIRRIENARTLALYDKTDTCVIGKREDLLQHAEDTVWSETIYGARMPFLADVKPSDVELRSPPIFMTKEQWCQNSEYVMVGWKQEELQGQKIERVVPLPGADAGFLTCKMPLLEGTQMPGRMVAYFGGTF